MRISPLKISIFKPNISFNWFQVASQRTHSFLLLAAETYINQLNYSEVVHRNVRFDFDQFSINLTRPARRSEPAWALRKRSESSPHSIFAASARISLSESRPRHKNDLFVRTHDVIKKTLIPLPSWVAHTPTPKLRRSLEVHGPKDIYTAYKYSHWYCWACTRCQR